MDSLCLIKGAIVGFVLPIPIGPAGILCIQRTVVQGRLHGFLTGLSAALSDMMYGIVAAFGISLASAFTVEHCNELRFAGGIVLLVLGCYSLRRAPSGERESHPAMSPALSFVSTFLVTLTNPMTLFAYTVVFVLVDAVDPTTVYWSKALLVAGVFFGSLGWYSLLTLLSSNLSVAFSLARGALFTRLSGSLLMLLGISALVMSLRTVLPNQ